MAMRERSSLLAASSPQERFDSAELVVIGRITDATARCDGPLIMTYLQVQVEESLKNPQGVRDLTARTHRGTIGDYSFWVEDLPILKTGDRAFLYLFRERPTDDVYNVGSYSGALVRDDLPDESISGREILETFQLRFITNEDGSLVAGIPRGSSKQVTLNLESFFGYNTETIVSVSSFGKSDRHGVFNTSNLTRLEEFGISIEPTSVVITPAVNGTAQAKFLVSASEDAALGAYEIVVSATKEDGYSYLSGGAGEAYFRVNVTENDNYDASQYAAMSLNIEKHGKREFYQDRKVFLPTNFTLSDSSVLGPDTTLSWPSIGPNYIIRNDSDSSSTVVFDYYKSLGFTGLAGIQYDEHFRIVDIPPPPALAGRYFGFDWNQTALDGTRAGPGRYSVQLTMPVMISNGSSDDRIILTSTPDFFTILEGTPDDLAHEFSLKLSVSKTDLETGEPFTYQLLLLNNANHPEVFTIDHNLLNIIKADALDLDHAQPCVLGSTGGIAGVWYFIHEHPLQPGASRVIEADGITGAPKYPGTYYFTGPVVLSVADEPLKGMSENDGIRASCLEVYVDPVILNVKAAVYEGISLVVGTDKPVYKQSETVTFSLFIENNSDRPFKLSEVQPTIHIIDVPSGKQVYSLSYVADYADYPTIQPHSRYNLTSSIPLKWDQTIFSHEGESRAELGKYVIKATFTLPYLESAEHSITIE
jgi:hypothetical protein